MLKLFVCTALIYLPIALLCGMLCFAAARWGLRRKNRTVRSVVKAGSLLCLAVLASGVMYGILRFSGIILFASDHAVSHHWFGASWRDEGFRCIYLCSIAFIGIAAALWAENRRVSNGGEGNALNGAL